MNFFNKLQAGLEKVVGPFAAMVANSKYIKALTEGFMCTMPITLGVAVIAVLSNLPIDPWIEFLNSTGLYAVGQEVVSLTLSLLAIYVVGAIGYCFTRNEGEQGIIGAVMATAAFIILMPIQTFTDNTGSSVTSLATDYMGSDGIFLALILGLLIPRIYCFLMNKNLRLKLPDSVPPMVSQSLAPTFVAMIIFTLVFILKWACTFTPYGNVFNVVSTIIGQPISYFGASPISLIIVFSLMNLIWFFGIHPNAILMPYMPVLMMVSMANTEAFLAGKTMPYLVFALVSTCVQIGGAGNTLGLCIATLFAKSEKYKAMRKLVIPANIFNINEPIIFGFPIMLNPLYIIPMIFSPAASGLTAWFLVGILPIEFNPTISMPWVTPGFITTFFQGGIFLLLLWLISLAIHFVMYLPFFLIDDNNALKQEQNMETEN
ncbi:PTS transporter subunit EIIC [Thomasclavelia sp.]|uniref:PTS sugar transporter subunit IIC n=1 Tax=Thomasclavelia sp. TaxID=3025757 RepID=UPI0025CEBE0A|nr:PTS transporter subunit EIIC [Thomasclavelia sp.]